MTKEQNELAAKNMIAKVLEWLACEYTVVSGEDYARFPLESLTKLHDACDLLKIALQTLGEDGE
jgi:hypothetical protein